MRRTTPRFRSQLAALPRPVQAVARKNYRLLKRDPAHPSLHFKKIGRFWSARVGLEHRALAVQDGDDFIWVWIGNHDSYEQLIARQ